jgi:CRP-like cAMP-binding protein
MSNALTMKLQQFTHFNVSERERLDELTNRPRKSFARGETIIREGKKVRDIHLVLTGLAARSKTLASGARQTLAFLVPGDLCDVEVFVLQAMDHDITAVSDTTCALIPTGEMERLLSESSNITKALWWSTMTDSAVLRERIVDHGSRDARQHLAHMFCEMLIRYLIIGDAEDNAFPFPLTQEELGEATGMTPPHVNRILQQLRSDGLIEWKSKVLRVLDAERLMKVAQFQAAYLHLNRTEGRDPEVSGRAGDLVPASSKGLVQDAIDKVKGVLR